MCAKYFLFTLTMSIIQSTEGCLKYGDFGSSYDHISISLWGYSKTTSKSGGEQLLEIWLCMTDFQDGERVFWLRKRHTRCTCVFCNKRVISLHALLHGTCNIQVMVSSSQLLSLDLIGALAFFLLNDGIGTDKFHLGKKLFMYKAFLPELGSPYIEGVLKIILKNILPNYSLLKSKTFLNL